MRYYEIIITNPKTGEIIRPKGFERLRLDATYSSFVGGKTLQGALNVEFNMPLYNFATPRQGSFARVWGVSNEELSQANRLADFDITIKAGMQKGLPLAKPQQNGVIVKGKIFQAYGNAVGTDRTLDLILMPSVGSRNAPSNFSFKWPKGTPLSDALKATLQVALPDYQIKMSISADLKSAADQTGVYGSLVEFSTMVKRLSLGSQFAGIRPMGGGPYPGVEITVKDKTVLVYDRTSNYGGATESDPLAIAFEDLIGQPTWLGPATINFRCAMRADISVGDYVKLPEKMTSPYVLTSQQAAIPGSPSRNTSTFKGKFVVQYVQHFGNYRQPDAASWVTSFEAVPSPPPEDVTRLGSPSP